jgi:hypothetical protein
MRSVFVLVTILLPLAACATRRPCLEAGRPPVIGAPYAWAVPESTDDTKTGSAAGVGSVGWTILMYLPNRVLDLFDMVRFGVDVGPGIAGQAKATDAAQVQAFSRASVGAGLQGLRHLPVQMSTESGAGVGPIELTPTAGFGWFESPTDVRVLAHALLVGAHVAVDPVEIGDFVTGLVLIDIRDDDY